LKGATAAFLLNPPPVAGDPFGQTAEIGAALAQAVRRADLSRSVILSSIGAQHETGTGVIATLHQVEAMLAGTAPATAFLRSGYFVETWSEVAEACVSEGVLPSFLEPDRKIPMVSTSDVGRAAARLMSHNWAGTRIVELAEPEDWSASDVAAAFAKVLGRPVEPVLVRRSSAKRSWPRRGSPRRLQPPCSACTKALQTAASRARPEPNIGVARHR
jgi:uncharacterized protein YbjT (DUF2867 family)